MLVLARKVGESVVIGDGITVTVLEVGRSGQIRLGIDAPKTTRIYRRELLDQIQAENRTALASPEALALLARILPPA